MKLDEFFELNFYKLYDFVWKHKSTGIPFVFVKGGEVRLGFDAVKIRMLKNELERQGETLLISQCCLQERYAFIKPMLIAIEPVNSALAGIYCRDSLERPEFTSWSEIQTPAYFSLQRASQFCKKFGFSLPTADELETCSTRFKSELYDFGAMPDESRFEKVISPKLNGRESSKLRGSCYAHWTESREIETGESILRGGGAELLPWQNCGEWQLCLSCARWPISAHFSETGVLRPVVRAPEGMF